MMYAWIFIRYEVNRVERSNDKKDFQKGARKSEKRRVKLNLTKLMGSTVIYEITVRDVLMDFIAEILIWSKRE